MWGQRPVEHEGDMTATTIWPTAGASSPEFRGNQVHISTDTIRTGLACARPPDWLSIDPLNLRCATPRRVRCTGTRRCQWATSSVGTGG